MKIAINYNIGKILEESKETVNPEISFIYKEIHKYKVNTEKRIDEYIAGISSMTGSEQISWAQEHAPIDIKQYVIRKLLHKDYDVLKKGANTWKTLNDIGFDIKEEARCQQDYSEWISLWEEKAKIIKDYNKPIIESHAHYNLENFKHFQDRLLSILHNSANIEKIVIPAISFDSNYEIIWKFDVEAYDYVYYAFGIHPKYAYKDKLANKTMERLDDLIKRTQKCIAVGESGLDYSYSEFNEEHRNVQMETFVESIDVANKHNLPMILHIRPEEKDSKKKDIHKDAVEILRNYKINKDAVLHCFKGNTGILNDYLSVGIRYFGIGGYVTYGDKDFEEAVKNMPEESIILETDSPYIKLTKDNMPNTSLSLIDIAKKISEIRGANVEHILDVAYKNVIRLFFEHC